MKYDPYASHFPVLLQVLRCLMPSSILEIGAGFYSTPLLESWTYARGGEHYILETDSAWAKSISSLFGIKITNFCGGQLPIEVNRNWDMAFIDCAVERTRAGYALALRENARIIILHDSNPDWDAAYKYSAIIPQWKHHRQFAACYPHTLLLSNTDDVSSFFWL